MLIIFYKINNTDKKFTNSLQSLVKGKRSYSDKHRNKLFLNRRNSVNKVINSQPEGYE